MPRQTVTAVLSLLADHSKWTVVKEHDKTIEEGWLWDEWIHANGTRLFRRRTSWTRYVVRGLIVDQFSWSESKRIDRAVDQMQAEKMLCNQLSSLEG